MLYEQQAKSKGLYLNLITGPDLPEALLGDPLRLRQILLNLVSNALKFTSEGGVSLHVKGKKEESGVLAMQFEVRDTGPGIAPEAQKRIFKAFEQEDDATARNHGGTGLGLAISARLVNLQKGELTVQSSQGKGATFTVKLPYKEGSKQDLPRKASPKKAVRSFAGIRVLAADDDSYNRELLAMLLDRWKISYTLVEDGEAAVTAAFRDEFDLILVDLRMPGLSGLDVAKNIRQKFDQVPIIALTATATSKDRETAKEVGIHDFLIKPYKPEALADLIGRYVGERKHKKTSIAEPVEPKPEASAGYDPARLEAMANGNPAFVKKMLGLFVDNGKKQVPAWKDAALKKDWPVVGNIAHRLAPSVRQLGNQDLYDGLKALEKAVEELAEPEEMASDLIQKLEKMLTVVEADLAARD
ncbi:MAG: ATP-binding protein [Bacteroidia bacterium]